MTVAPKGNLVVGQSGGPTQVINQSLVGVIEEALKHTTFEGILGAVNGIAGILMKNFVDLRRESHDTLQSVAATPGAALGSCRFKPKDADCEKVFEIFRELNVHYFFYIGGNDSALAAATLNKIARERKYELRIFHVPKTIDNDLLVTDHCPGYGSAAKYVASTIVGNDMDNRALPGVKIDICMGRSAGWLTASAACARNGDSDAPHLIYLPERRKKLTEILEDIFAVYDTYGRCSVAISEGVVGPDGFEMIASPAIAEELKSLGMEAIIDSISIQGKVEEAAGGTSHDAFGHPQLSGSGALGDFFADALKIYWYRKTKKRLRVRADTLGYAQRSFAGCVSKVDAEEARIVGREAVKYSIQGDIDGSIALRRIGDGENYLSEPFLAKLEEVAGLGKPKNEQFRPVPPEFINDKGNGMTQAFVDYALPLLGGIPQKGVLKSVPVRSNSLSKH
ncbi:MAG: 6-phosphofructokinase [bacterium]